jgi:hypothetical protein
LRQEPSPKRMAKSRPSSARSTRLLLVGVRRSTNGCATHSRSMTRCQCSMPKRICCEACELWRRKRGRCHSENLPSRDEKQKKYNQTKIIIKRSHVAAPETRELASHSHVLHE